MTEPSLTGAELDAGFEAAKEAIDARITGWIRRMITDDLIMALVAVVVDAVDKVRDQPPPPEGEPPDVNA